MLCATEDKMICNSGPKVQHDHLGTAKDSSDEIRTI
jgi:hypothetical protein